MNLFKHLFPGKALSQMEDRLIRSQLRHEVHIVDKPDSGVIFVRPALEIYACSRAGGQALKSFLNGNSRIEASKETGLDSLELEALLHLLLEKNQESVNPVQEEPSKRVLERLVLNVTHQCNLNCRYCYAQGGDYGLERSMMTRDIALKILNVFYSLFDEIKQIQFFGGEPLLNPDIIDFVCSEIEDRHKNGVVQDVPHFGLVTNGTILSSQVFECLSRHGINATVSLDGPRRVNDHLRGQGTYDRVRTFLHRLEKHSLGFSFEATYTAHHLHSGMRLRDLLDFFVSEFDRREMHIPVVSLPPDHPLAVPDHLAEALYREGVEYSIRNIRQGRTPFLSFATRLMNVFLDRKPIEYRCPAGFGTIAVDVHGTVFPCFMFTGLERFCLGSVFDEVFPDTRRVSRVFDTVAACNKAGDLQCQNCWALPFCFGCIGADYFKSGERLQKTECGFIKAMTEGFLSSVIEFLDDLPVDGAREEAESNQTLRAMTC